MNTGRYPHPHEIAAGVQPPTCSHCRATITKAEFEERDTCSNMTGVWACDRCRTAPAAEPASNRVALHGDWVAYDGEILPEGMALALQRERGGAIWYQMNCPKCGKPVTSLPVTLDTPEKRPEPCPRCLAREEEARRIEEWNRLGRP